METHGKPPLNNQQEIQYLSNRLDVVRKECQWLLSLGAANVLGNVFRQVASPGNEAGIKQITLTVIGVQMLLSLFGSVGFLSSEIDPAEHAGHLRQRLKLRVRLRNWSAFLLVAGFGLLAFQLW